MNALVFSHEDAERAAAYHRPLYAAAALDLALAAGVYALLGWTPVGRALWAAVPAGWAAAAPVWAALVAGCAAVVRLPLALWRGLLRERRFGFSTQSGAAWARDRGKMLLLDALFTAAAWTAAVALARALPRWWPAAAAGALALALLLLSFVAPVLLEPLFNRFRPLADERLARELRALAARTGVPVRDVLVSDASRRTTKVNAYVSGIGGTRRIVLFDTLLASVGERELQVIVAHELGHRRERHVAKATALGMLGAAAGVLVLWAALGASVGDPRELPAALLLLLGLELAAAPFGAALSRRWERVADRCSLDATGDAEAFERAHVGLARRNLADLAPPRLAYLLLFTHPTPPERLAIAQDWSRARASA